MSAFVPAARPKVVVRFDDGSWTDVAVWSDRADADAACSMDPPPELLAFFEHIAEDVSMDLVQVACER